MQNKKPAIFKYGEDPSAFTPEDYLRALFEAAGEDGTLVIPGEDYCDDFRTVRDGATDVTVRMRPTTEGDREELIVRAGFLIGIFEALADDPGIIETAYSGVRAVYESYIDGFETGMVPADENVPLEKAAEAEVLTAHRAANAADAARRVGEGPYAYAVVMRAGRLYRLHLLNAPEAVVSAEARLFAQALALHEFARKSIETQK